MTADFKPTGAFSGNDFPDAERPFPIVEVFGYHRELRTPQARRAFVARACPFAENDCEKFRQYGYGYCSVSYRTDWDTEPHPYAVCDHRLDGPPVDLAITDYFGEVPRDSIAVVPEVVLTEPRQSFDFIALEKDGSRFVGIEAQAIDLRGGGVGPAFSSILDGEPRTWRRRFTEEARKKGRKDTVAYGVNTANIYKRLGLQVAEKAAMLRKWDSKLYVVAQQRPFDYLIRRTNVEWITTDDWEVTFVVFDYTGAVLPDGRLEFVHKATYRTKVDLFAKGLVTPTSRVTARQFLRRVRKKAGLEP